MANINGHVSSSSVRDTGTSRVASPSPPDDSTPLRGWCDTQINVVKISFIWTITNFSFDLMESGKYFKSDKFSARANDKIKWRLKLYPSGNKKQSEDFLSLFLLLDSCSNSDVKAKFKFSILNEKRQKTRTKESRDAYHFVPDKDRGFEKFISHKVLFNEINGLLTNDELTIFCEVSVIEDSVNSSGQSNVVQLRVPECSLNDDLGHLFESRINSDMTFIVGGKEIQVHKAVLAGRSTAFAAMFEHEMEERTGNRVEITDVNSDVFEEMLRFIYTGKSTNLERMASDLLPAADKYGLDRLKVMCAEALYKGLRIDNAANVLILAHLYAIDQLKAHTIHFINVHSANMIETSGWTSLVKSHPLLLVEVYQARASKKIPPMIGPSRKRTKQN